MAKAVTCPICFGSGKVNNPNYQVYTHEQPKKTCHGCGGKGWVTVSD